MTDQASKTWLKRWAPAGLLVLATIVVYLPAMRGGMIIDDPEHIARDELKSLGGLWRIWFEIGATAHYYPLLNTAFWLEYQLWGDAVLGFHLMNALQHAASACLVVAITRRLGLPGAWLAGGLFALHPVCVESVAWMAEQKNTLSGLFFLAAAFTYLGYDQQRKRSWYWLAFALFLLALGTKTVTATLAPTLLVIFWWQRGRLSWRRDVVPLLPWFLVGAGAGLFSAWFEQTHSFAQGSAFDLGFVERVLLAGRALVFYATTLVLPVNLMFINPRWVIDDAVAWQYLFPFAGFVVTAVLVWRARRQRGPLAAWLVFAGNLFPTLGFLNINWFNFSFVADHFQYLAMLGLLVPFAAWATATFMRRGPSTLLLRQGAGAALLVVLAVLSWRQSGIYRSAEALYRDTLARNPACWLAHNNLGVLLAEDDARLAEAIDHFETALRLKPDHARAYNNLGHAYSRLPGRMPDAIAAYERSLALQYDTPQVHLNLAEALRQTPGREVDAIAAYREAVRLAPHSWEALLGLADALADTPGGEKESVERYRELIRLKPELPAAHNNLGRVLVRTGHTAEAIESFAAALRLDPDNLDAHYNLGSVLADVPGQASVAVSHLEAALRLAPGDASIYNNLGSVLMGLPGRRHDAIRNLETALRLRPDLAEAHFNLGRIHLTPPVDEPRALQHFEAAASLRPDWEAPARFVARLKDRLH